MVDPYAAFDSPLVATGSLQGVPDVAKASGSASSTRTRDTYTLEEVNAIDRAAKVLVAHGDRMRLRCGAELCPDRDIKPEADPTSDRGGVLACGCTVRVFQRDKGASDRQAAAAARRMRRGQKRRAR